MATMISTKDNPFNPLENYKDWHQFDVMMGYNTASLLSRLSNTSDTLPEEENELEIRRAMTTMITELNFNDNYIIVTDDKEEGNND